MSYRTPNVLCVLIALSVLQGCNATAAPPGSVAIRSPDIQAASAVGRAPHGNQGNYVLRPNDKLRVKVFNEPEISGEYQIDAGGFVSIPLAGRIRAGGHTTGQVERILVSRLNDGVIRDPKANVEVVAHAPFYILGEVKQPAEIQYKPGLTVLDAVAAAGGFTYRANEEKIYIRRAGSELEEIHSTRVPVPVFPGDNIRVPERYF